jgi:hypothetical protein
VSPAGRVHGRHRSVTFRKTYRDVNFAKLSGLSLNGTQNQMHGHTVGCETTFRSGCRSVRDDRDEIQFHLQKNYLWDSISNARFADRRFSRDFHREFESFTVSAFSHNFHFSAPFPAIAKLRVFRASDFTPRVKERIAAEMRVAHDLRSSWPETTTRDCMS